MEKRGRRRRGRREDDEDGREDQEDGGKDMRRKTTRTVLRKEEARKILGRRRPLTPGPALILNSRTGKLGLREVYISFVGEDKRLDAWVPISSVGEEVALAGPSRVKVSRCSLGITQPLTAATKPAG